MSVAKSGCSGAILHGKINKFHILDVYYSNIENIINIYIDMKYILNWNFKKKVKQFEQNLWTMVG